MTAKGPVVTSLLSVVTELSTVSLSSSGFLRLARIKCPRHDVVQYVVRQIVFVTPYRNRVRNCSACRVSEPFCSDQALSMNPPSSILRSDSTVTRCFFANSLE